MAKYECPECGGGFPEPIMNRCAWCGELLDMEEGGAV